MVCNTSSIASGGLGGPQYFKPVSRLQKSTGIKPPSIVTKPGTAPSQVQSSTTTQKGSSSLPPIAPLTSAQTSSATATAAITAVATAVAKTVEATTAASSPLTTVSSAIPIPTPSFNVGSQSSRSKNRILTVSKAQDFSVQDALVSLKDAPAIVPVKTGTTLPKLLNCSPVNKKPTKSVLSSPSAPTSPSATLSRAGTRIRTRTISSPSTSVTDVTKKATLAMVRSSSVSTKTTTRRSSEEHLTLATPTTPSPVKDELLSLTAAVDKCRRTSTEAMDPKPSRGSSETVHTSVEGTVTSAIKCSCLPPIEFPENVKQELKRQESEHRERECDLYTKIIELQIENANLKGEKETLSRQVERRDRLLLETRMQLQALEFVCHENNVKVDIDMRSDEDLANWNFEESDKTYQRILVVMKDLLRDGSSCVEESEAMMRSGSRRPRSSRSSSSATTAPCGSRASGPDSEVLRFDPQSLRSDRQLNTTSALTQALMTAASSSPGSGRRGLDCGTDRSNLFRSSSEENAYGDEDDEDDEDDDDDDDDDEGQESEFEELGEEMIKYVELQPSIMPRRDSRALAAKMMPLASPGGLDPGLSTAVLMKNLWNSSGARRSGGTTPLFHPGYQQPPQPQHQNGPVSMSRRISGSSTASNGSMLDDYFGRPQYTADRGQAQSPLPFSPPSFSQSFYGQQQPCQTGVGLGLIGMGRSPEVPAMEKFGKMVMPVQTNAQLLDAFPRPGGPLSPAFPFRSVGPIGSVGSNHSFGSNHSHHSSSSSISSSTNLVLQGLPPPPSRQLPPPPPPMIPLPPLPTTRPASSLREHTKSRLLESRRPSHGRTNSHGFVIEGVNQFLRRRAFGKAVTREVMNRGHRRRESV
ncbi:hypothetical protein BGW38_002517 [Lunasporangiospora selenospora]|uniref:Uncharacterized protein n=1 Tax=Lunasporangiospora selenospora TaxID=979761 RepID=A0A9P6G238_9FUNG|nr:hypothetical protein BGW38_002517 [Lunasporangiospora selenospora]